MRMTAIWALLVAGGTVFGQGAKIIELPKPDLVEGEQLRAQLLARPPAASAVNGLLKIRTGDDRRSVPVRLTTQVLSNGVWEASYEARGEQREKLAVRHAPGAANVYVLTRGEGAATELTDGKIFAAFAGSDFAPAELGLDFLHWPTQATLGGGLHNGRPYKTLESSRTNAPPGGYVRVRSRVDTETGGITQAEAFDAKGRTVKEFSLTSFKKVDGVWQLREMKMISEPRDSVSRLEFELDVKSPE